MLQFPAPLRRGDRIGVTSPSAGVEGASADRIDFCAGWLREAGFDVVVGRLMDGSGITSGPAADRAAELTAMLCDPTIRCVIPPWGGETAIDLVDLLDWDALGVVADWWRFEEDPHATRWKTVGPGRWELHGADSLRVTGQLIGGCVETMANLAGTPYGDVAAFGRAHTSDGLIVYLEAAEDEAATICRNLHGLRLAGWFDDARAVLIGRTRAPDHPRLSQRDAVLDALGRLGIPIVFDVEVGHVPPHLPLVNGALATLTVDGDVHEIVQRLA